MAASTSSTSHPKSYTYFGDIPEEVRDMMLCHACNLQPFHKDNAIVLPCAHVMCLDCVSDRVSKTATRDKVECPKCAEEWTIPFGNIYAFPRDFFSLVLNNILQGKSHGMVRPNPKCAIHPKENVSRHCKQCSLTACELCHERHHKEHSVELIETGRESIDRELTSLKCTLNSKIYQIGDMIEVLRKDQTKMAADIKWTCNQIQQTIQENTDRECCELKLRQNNIREVALDNCVQLNLQQEKIQEEAQEKIHQLQVRKNKIEEETQQSIRELDLRQERLQEEVQERINGINHNQGRLKVQFEKTLTQLKEQKKSLENDQLFIDILHNMGNESDKLSRVPGMKNMVENGKHFSGKKLDLETLCWKVATDKHEADMNTCSLVGNLQIAESTVESLGENEESFCRGLHNTGTVPISCGESILGPRSVTLFNQQHIIHLCDLANDADKICIHNTSRGVYRRIPVPGITWCAAPVVVDDSGGVIVVADTVQGWIDEMRAGNFNIHLSGSLHWLTLNESYEIVQHEVIPMQCMRSGYMNVNHAGHLLVLTLCTTNIHPKQLVVYGNNRCVLHTIILSDMFLLPMSAVNSFPDKFVVVDGGKNQVFWIDHHGQVLQQYGHRPGEELNCPIHIVQHSKGSLLITDRDNHKVHLVSDEGKLLQYLLHETDVKCPVTLHLDEQNGLLCVQYQNEEYSTSILAFRFWPFPTRIKQLCLQTSCTEQHTMGNSQVTCQQVDGNLTDTDLALPSAGHNE